MNAHFRPSVTDWLREQNIPLRDTRPGDHKTTCPQCSASRRNKSDPCLSVTIKAGDDVVVNCHHCGWTAGNAQVRERTSRSVYNRPEPVSAPERPDTLFTWFEKRGISAPTVVHFGVYKTKQWFPQTGGEAECIAFPYMWQGVLRNVKYRTKEKHFRQEKNPEPVLFNADCIPDGGDLVICEGEVDAMSFHECGYKAVSLPNGAPAKDGGGSEKRYEPLATHEEALGTVRRIFIATDTDQPGENLAQELARRLGRDRCFRVRYDFANEVSYKDANEVLVSEGMEGIKACIEAAQPWPIDGLHDAADYSDEVDDLYEGRTARPLTIGFPQFDDVFRILPGQFVVVTGIPNHGKSRFVDQVAVQMARRYDWHWGVFSPETGEANHIADLCEIRVSKPFFEGVNPRMSREEMESAKRWVGQYFSFIATADHTPSIDWILERARALVLRKGLNALIIDPYNEIEAGRPKEMTETEFVSQLISKCKRFAKLHDVTIFMIVHPTKLRAVPGEKEPIPGLYDLSGSAHWRNKADAGLVVYRDYENKKTVVIAKKIRRQPMCGTPGSVDFVFIGAERIFTEIHGTRRSLGAE